MHTEVALFHISTYNHFNKLFQKDIHFQRDEKHHFKLLFIKSKSSSKYGTHNLSLILTITQIPIELCKIVCWLNLSNSHSSLNLIEGTQIDVVLFSDNERDLNLHNFSFHGKWFSTCDIYRSNYYVNTNSQICLEEQLIESCK